MKKIKNKQYGQAMVEFALTLPIFLLAVIGVIELSRFFLVYSSVYTASREAARFGSSVGEDGILHYLDCDGIKKVAVDMGSFGGVNDADPNKIDIYYESSPGVIRGNCGDFIKDNIILGDRLVVDISVEYKPLLVDLVLPDGIMVSAKNGRTIMKEIKLDITPLPTPNCVADVVFSGTLKNPSIKDKNIVTINVKNNSLNSYYILDQINNVRWKAETPARYLYYINWGDTNIWKFDLNNLNNNLPGFNVTLEKNTSRIIPAGETKTLLLEFNKGTDIDYIGFSLSIVSSDGFYNCSLNITPNK